MCWIHIWNFCDRDITKFIFSSFSTFFKFLPFCDIFIKMIYAKHIVYKFQFAIDERGAYKIWKGHQNNFSSLREILVVIMILPKNTLHLQQLNDISIQIGRNCVQIPERHAIDERVIKHEKGITTFLVHLKTFWLLSCYILEGSKNTFHKLGWIVFKFLKGMLLTKEGL